VHVNSPPKSGPKPHRSAASFCHLFLLRVCVYYVLMERPSRLRDVITLGGSFL
jgi:hypothetical protein